MAEFDSPLLSTIADTGSTQAAIQASNTTQALQRAQTGYAQAQAAGQQIGNQRALLQLQLLQNALGGLQGLSGGQDAVGQNDNNSQPGESESAPSSPPVSSTNANGEPLWDPAAVQQALRARFWVNPVGTPQEQQAVAKANLGGPEVAAYAKQIRDQNVATRQAVAEKNANNLYDGLYSVATVDDGAPTGTALALLGRISPQAASRISAEYKDDPGAADAAAVEYAEHLGSAVHQYTGRKAVQDSSGVYRDEVTGQPILGVPKTGVSSKDIADLAQKGQTLVDVPQSDGSTIKMQQWQADGAPNLSSWLMRTLKSSGQVPPSGAPNEATRQAARQASRTAQAAPGAPSNTPTSSDPTMNSALADKEYRLTVPKVKLGQSATPGQIDQQKAVVASRAELFKDSQTATQAASQALQYLSAAQAVLDSGGRVPSGLTASAQNLISRALQGVGGGSYATKYQEIAKFLSNAALQNARALYGSRMTQTEVRLQLEEMNPNVEMTPTALRALVTDNMRQAQYTLQSARRVRPYLAAGNDPQSFSEWNQQYWPAEQAVTRGAEPAQPYAPTGGAVPTATGPGGQKLYLRNGQWVSK